MIIQNILFFPVDHINSESSSIPPPKSSKMNVVLLAESNLISFHQEIRFDLTFVLKPSGS
jgi:hypothetical protein